jgi:signal transduction histidine kinase
MVERVETAHVELGSRFNEARTLASELELANTRLQQVVQDLDAARVDAQQASRAKSEFLATMSHEIRTPINAMIGYADLLDMGVTGDLSAQQQEYMDRIRRSGEHLIALVNDVLDFAKVESGQMRIAAEARHARPVIDAALSMMHAPAAKKGVVVDVSCNGDTAFIGDPQRVKQIVLNLLSNALKFTDPGGHVRITCTRRDSAPAQIGDSGRHQWTCITVADDGPGIDEQQRESIFEPFVQGTSGYTRPHGGTGLGLAISRSLARLMDGDLTLDSAPGEGATFTVWLPHASAAGRTAA